MTNRTSQSLTAWFLLWDLGLTAIGWPLAYWIRFETGLIPIYRPIPELAQYLESLPVILLLALISYRAAGMYVVHRMRRFREELAAVARGIGLMALVVMATSFVRQAQYESRAVMVIFTAMVFVAVIAARRAGWSAVRLLRSHGVNQSHALIVGTGRVARRTARTLRQVSWTGIQPVGFVEDFPARGPTDLPVVGRIAELPVLIGLHHIEHVFIALPLNRYADARRVFDALSQSVVDVRLIPDVPALAGLALTTTNLHGMTVIGLRESPHYGLNVVVKRAMDFVLAAIGLVALSPLMVVIAAIIKATSPGPILYRQERCGLNGRPFMMLKFRSLRIDAEANGPRMTEKDDPRRTWFGAFLRVSNLDELPQLVNVLKGDMSLVGPRPERPVFVQEFAKSIPNYMVRHAVKAGMTGWAQVNGWRGNSSLRKRIQFDLYYITHWNPLFDVRILFLTIWRMLFQRQKHAY